MRFDPVAKDDIYSTTEAAEAVGVHPVTLRRWLATGGGQSTGEFQQWLTAHHRSALKFIELSNGKRVWQFGNQNRTDLREFKQEKDGGVGEDNKPNAVRLTRPRLRGDERRQNVLFKRYAKVLVDLQSIGFAPQDAHLVQVTRRRVAESAILQAVTQGFHLSEHRRVAEELGRAFSPRSKADMRNNENA
jgi:hypothetical protein